ncbi:hypothetical protein BJ684DRAFT_20648 [Piptocephalis cylindrospora]|uniref:Uncharacterized protein n=1 Tax=Piptocephalis cylindrospora TaxID=1907219 RepID=A0A4P9Y4T4_9FUNG|nr:hypothetical protein BJ684DRAFT_20648 [Piptocephalis cylindrospora]|eukprot:RKP12830.1 hypothetical protein BJ684DRAFT_20648 [Piptocephalis cylindrospora]
MSSLIQAAAEEDTPTPPTPTTPSSALFRRITLERGGTPSSVSASARKARRLKRRLAFYPSTASTTTTSSSSSTAPKSPSPEKSWDHAEERRAIEEERQRIRSLEASLEIREAEARELAGRLTLIGQEIAQREARNEEGGAALEKEHSRLVAAHEALLQDHEMARGAAARYRSRCEDMEAKLDSADATLSALEERRRADVEDLAEARAQAARLEEERTAAELAREELEAEAKAARVAANRSKLQVRTLESSLSQTEQSASELRDRLTLLDDQARTREGALESIRREVRAKEMEREAAEAAARTLSEQLTGFQEVERELRDRLDQEVAVRRSLEHEVEGLQHRIEEVDHMGGGAPPLGSSMDPAFAGLDHGSDPMGGSIDPGNSLGSSFAAELSTTSLSNELGGFFDPGPHPEPPDHGHSRGPAEPIPPLFTESAGDLTGLSSSSSPPTTPEYGDPDLGIHHPTPSRGRRKEAGVIGQLKARLRDAKTAREEASRELDSAVQELTTARERAAGAEQAVESERLRAAGAEAALEDARSGRAQAQQEAKEATDRATRLEGALEEARREAGEGAAGAAERLAEAEKEVASVREELAGAEGRLAGAEGKAAHLQKAVEEREAALARAAAECEAVRAALRDTEARAAREREDAAGLLSRVTEEKRALASRLAGAEEAKAEAGAALRKERRARMSGESEVGGVGELVSRVEGSLQALAGTRERAKDRSKGWEQRVRGCGTEVSSLLSRLQGLEAGAGAGAVAEATREADVSRSAHQLAIEALEGERARMTRTQEEMEGRERRLQELTTAIQALEGVMDEAIFKDIPSTPPQDPSLPSTEDVSEQDIQGILEDIHQLQQHNHQVKDQDDEAFTGPVRSLWLRVHSTHSRLLSQAAGVTRQIKGLQVELSDQSSSITRSTSLLEARALELAYEESRRDKIIAWVGRWRERGAVRIVKVKPGSKPAKTTDSDKSGDADKSEDPKKPQGLEEERVLQVLRENRRLQARLEVCQGKVDGLIQRYRKAQAEASLVKPSHTMGTGLARSPVRSGPHRSSSPSATSLSSPCNSNSSSTSNSSSSSRTSPSPPSSGISSSFRPRRRSPLVREDRRRPGSPGRHPSSSPPTLSSRTRAMSVSGPIPSSSTSSSGKRKESEGSLLMGRKVAFLSSSPQRPLIPGGIVLRGAFSVLSGSGSGSGSPTPSPRRAPSTLQSNLHRGPQAAVVKRGSTLKKRLSRPSGEKKEKKKVTMKDEEESEKKEEPEEEKKKPEENESEKEGPEEQNGTLIVA